MAPQRAGAAANSRGIAKVETPGEVVTAATAAAAAPVPALTPAPATAAAMWRG